MMCSLKPESAPAMIEVLTPIWQRVLGLSSIRIEDNFFDLGATPRWLFNYLPKSRGCVVENCHLS